MRGKVCLHYAAYCVRRITPAHAGKRAPLCRQRYSSEDHPRACGEKLVRLRHDTARQGSPPRMRGKVPHEGGERIPGGITPAHAGKSGTKSADSGAVKDHPRACGEKQNQNAKNARRLWITPAHAGKSQKLYRKKRQYRDHPRACGEKSYILHI